MLLSIPGLAYLLTLFFTFPQPLRHTGRSDLVRAGHRLGSHEVLVVASLQKWSLWFILDERTHQTIQTLAAKHSVDIEKDLDSSVDLTHS